MTKITLHNESVITILCQVVHLPSELASDVTLEIQI